MSYDENKEKFAKHMLAGRGETLHADVVQDLMIKAMDSAYMHGFGDGYEHHKEVIGYVACGKREGIGMCRKPQNHDGDCVYV